MPTESQYTRNFLKLFRSTYPESVALKINDRTTAGILDSAIVIDGQTLWVEFKKDRPKLTPLQRESLRRLDHASEGRAIVLVFKGSGLKRTIDIFDVDYDVRGAIYEDLPWAEAITQTAQIARYGSEWPAPEAVQ